MSAAGPSGDPLPLRDQPHRLPGSEPELLYRGAIMDLVCREVDLGAAGTVRREYLRHPGAVAIVALDDQDRVLLLRQYRVPVGAYLWEVPAGLLDVEGEAPLEAAQRELAEEADLSAGTWHTLVDYFTSPGGSDEWVRVYLARDLREVPSAQRHERTGEEWGMIPSWLPLHDAVAAVTTGAVHNPSTVIGILAAHLARQRDYSTVRPPEIARTC